MNLLDAIRGLVRRWYISIPSVLLAVAVALGVWTITPAEYQRTAAQLLLPGENLLPEGETNQFLYLGGLSPVADVLTRAVNATEPVRELREGGAEIEIARDASAQGPVLLLSATAKSDAAAEEMVNTVLGLTETTLEQLQVDQGIALQDRVTVSTIAVDQTGKKIQRSRVVFTVAAGLGVALLGLAIASTVDGLVGRRRRRAKRSFLEDAEVLGSNSEFAPHEDEDLEVAEDSSSAPDEGIGERQEEPGPVPSVESLEAVDLPSDAVSGDEHDSDDSESVAVEPPRKKNHANRLESQRG